MDTITINVTLNTVPVTVSVVTNPVTVTVNYQVARDAYQLAKAEGFVGTRPEWLASLNGTDGREVELQTSATHVQWRYQGTVGWTDLIALADITGAPGQDGADSTVPGPDGDDGREVEFQSSGGYIQWRYVGEVSWTNLVALSAITGPAGSDANVTTSNVGVALATAADKTTPVDSDAIPMLDSAASNEPKLLSFANLWAWVKSKIDAGQTWAGTHAFSAATRPTSAGTGTPDASSLITRDDAESNMLFAMLTVRESDHAYYTANGGAASQNDGDNLLLSAATANLRPVALRYRNLNRAPSLSGAGNVVTALRVASAGTIIHIGAAANGAKFRFAVGMATGASVPAADANALTGRGFGWEVFWSTSNSRLEFGLFAHNGTNYVTSPIPLATGLNENYDNYWHVIVGLSASGTVTAWTWFGAIPAVTARPSGTPTLTLAGGPTSGTFANLGYCQWAAASHSTVAPSTANAVSVKVLDRKILIG